MSIKSYRPYTPSRRFITTNAREELTTDKPEKRLLLNIRKRQGRSSTGTITVRRRGGGHKRMLRSIDFKQDKHEVPATVASIEYDPMRSAFIAKLHYSDGEKRYILAAHGMQVGQKIVSSKKNAEIKNGNRMRLAILPTGTFVHNVELHPGQGGQLVRSAGAQAQIAAKEGAYVTLKFPSGEIRMVPKDCMASIGQIGNLDHRNVTIGKAGRSRWMGRRPQVRGTAMNPVDHPHGGGEGNTSIGLKHPKTLWGKPALGFKTRNKKKKSNVFIIKRRK